MKKKSKFQMTTMSIEYTFIWFIIGSIFLLETTSTPIEIAQLVGRNVFLNCPQNSSDDIKWIFNDQFNEDNRDTYIEFYDKGKFKGNQFTNRSRFEIDPATGKEILKISAIKPEDAGLYKCLDASRAPLQSTELTVLDSEPICDSNNKDNEFVGPNTCGLSQDGMHFSCIVSYHGTKAPRLQWEDAKNNQILKDVKCDGSQPNRTNCTLTLMAEPKYDGSVFRCKAVTSYGEQYNCNTGAIKVHYFIQKNDSSSSEATNENLNEFVISDQELRLTCADKERVWHNTHYVNLRRCTYSYDIKNTNCSTAEFDVMAPHTELLIWWLTILMIFMCIIILVITMPTIYWQYRKIHKLESKTSETHALKSNKVEV